MEHSELQNMRRKQNQQNPANERRVRSLDLDFLWSNWMNKVYKQESAIFRQLMLHKINIFLISFIHWWVFIYWCIHPVIRSKLESHGLTEWPRQMQIFYINFIVVELVNCHSNAKNICSMFIYYLVLVWHQMHLILLKNIPFSIKTLGTFLPLHGRYLKNSQTS